MDNGDLSDIDAMVGGVRGYASGGIVPSIILLFVLAVIYGRISSFAAPFGAGLANLLLWGKWPDKYDRVW